MNTIYFFIALFFIVVAAVVAVWACIRSYSKSEGVSALIFLFLAIVLGLCAFYMVEYELPKVGTQSIIVKEIVETNRDGKTVFSVHSEIELDRSIITLQTIEGDILEIKDGKLITNISLEQRLLGE